MARKKYFTEEERLAAKRERNRKYAKNNPDKVKESKRKYYQENSDKVKESNRKWRENNPDYEKQRYQENPEKERERLRKRYQENPDYWKKYQSTPIGRATTLLAAYNQADKERNRGECTLTAQWIVDNVFSGQRCFYCGETDWHKLGCDRIDNSLPHTPENVAPCCCDCNKKRGTKDFEEFSNQNITPPIGGAL